MIATLILVVTGIITYIVVRMSEAKTKKDREDRDD